MKPIITESNVEQIHSIKVFNAAVFQTDIEKTCLKSSAQGVKNTHINGKTMQTVKKRQIKSQIKVTAHLPFFKGLLKLNKFILLPRSIF